MPHITPTRPAASDRRRHPSPRGVVVLAVVGGLITSAVIATPAVAAPAGSSGPTVTVVDVTENDYDADGVIDVRVTASATSTKNGVPLSSVTDSDLDADGSVESRETTTSTYDKDGRHILEVLETDDGADGVPDFRVTISFEYDKSGKLVRTVETRDLDADGLDVSTVTQNITSAKKAETRIVLEADGDGDGIADQREVHLMKYDNRGNVVFDSTEFDFQADGTIDSEKRVTRTFDKNVLVSELTETAPDLTTDLYVNHFDSKGVLTGWTRTSQPSGYSETTTLAYDGKGRLVTQTDSIDVDGDGVEDERDVRMDTWSDKGDRVRSQLDVTGPAVVRYVDEYTYQDHLVVEHRLTRDDGADGVIDSISVDTSVYQRGLLMEYTTTDDSDADGSLDFSSRELYERDKFGRVIQRILETDFNGDGVIDDRTTSTHTSG